MTFRRLTSLLAGLIGVMFAGIGVLLLVIVASGNVHQGQVGMLIYGVGFLLVAAPMLAVPFSVPTARWLVWAVLAGFSGVAIWLAFWPQSGVVPSPAVKAAVAAFVGLLLVRIFLSRRDRN
ncbi:hypothetical protein [Pseudoxanthomonas kalamensis]|uniref:hypothetical protein n=1 Tax=Pseudoxanthomonas kalamensis TaxID=289483 RepID=UPI001390C4AF|nr:hypothetical protein [Pseudoxanthomonas kalamensis]